MKSPSLYRSLCTDFFDLDKPVAHPTEYAFYMHYVTQTNGPILEPMCGTGRYLIPMIEDGFTIDGFDASPFMLNALKQKCTQKNITPHVWTDYLETIQTHKKYELIFIPDCSLCLFLDDEKIKTCLKKIYYLLQPGGKFVFDIETVFSIPANIGIWQGKAYTKENGQHIVLNLLPLPIRDNIATVICRYELIENTEIIKTEVENFQIKLYKLFEMDALLEKIGFTTVKRLAAYNHDCEPDLYDHTIAYECTK